jgi:hypothetical protein
MSRISVLAGVCALVTLGSTVAQAQDPRAGVLGPASLALAGGPIARPQSASPVALVGSVRLGVSQPPVSDAAAAADPLVMFRKASVRHRGPGVALMIVGAAGVVTGLLIDESIITILGAGTGLIGLYIYLR